MKMPHCVCIEGNGDLDPAFINIFQLLWVASACRTIMSSPRNVYPLKLGGNCCGAIVDLSVSFCGSYKSPSTIFRVVEMQNMVEKWQGSQGGVRSSLLPSHLVLLLVQSVGKVAIPSECTVIVSFALFPVFLLCVNISAKYLGILMEGNTASRLLDVLFLSQHII